MQARTPSHVVYTNSFSLSLLFIWLLSLSLSLTHTLYVSHIHTHTLTREHERKSTKSFSAHRRKSLFSSVWSWSTEEVPFPRIEWLWYDFCSTWCFLKKWPIVYFRPFLNSMTNKKQNLTIKCVDSLLRIRTWDRRMVGTEESSVLWRPPCSTWCLCFCSFQIVQRRDIHFKWTRTTV